VRFKKGTKGLIGDLRGRHQWVFRLRELIVPPEGKLPNPAVGCRSEPQPLGDLQLPECPAKFPAITKCHLRWPRRWSLAAAFFSWLGRWPGFSPTLENRPPLRTKYGKQGEPESCFRPGESEPETDPAADSPWAPHHYPRSQRPGRPSHSGVQSPAKEGKQGQATCAWGVYPVDTEVRERAIQTFGCTQCSSHEDVISLIPTVQSRLLIIVKDRVDLGLPGHYPGAAIPRGGQPIQMAGGTRR